ncbi:MAG TPA: hypothetical protein VG186_10625 [Solirubrobacteraceae bacterium]|jgi:hypothetical protein|nr:hypothetical protein [Solirubrobacteraceae bacterium]
MTTNNPHSAVRDRELERQGKRIAAPARVFLPLGLVLAVPAVLLIVLADSWAYELGWALFLLATVPAVVAATLLGTAAVARWAAREKPFA